VVEFRLYCLDREGRIDLAEVIHAKTDEEAVAKARRLKRHTLKCEIWQGHRLVATLTADDLAA
jgi:hypothetical protein